MKFFDKEDWVTVHPNGPDAKGSPVLLEKSTGVVKAGMGGKHNGEKINELRKDFTGPKTPKGLAKAEPKKEPPKASEPKASKPAEPKAEEPRRVSGFYALAKRNHELEKAMTREQASAQKQEPRKEEPKESDAQPSESQKKLTSVIPLSVVEKGKRWQKGSLDRTYLRGEDVLNEIADTIGGKFDPKKRSITMPNGDKVLSGNKGFGLANYLEQGYVDNTTGKFMIGGREADIEQTIDSYLRFLPGHFKFKK